MSNLLKSKFLLGVMTVAIMFVGALALSNVASADCSITRTLRVGSKGTDVACLQTALGGLTADGSFGPKTKAAVMAFQTNEGLVADGVFGPKSNAAWVANQMTGNFPPGCTSAVGISPTTGQPCYAITPSLPPGCAAAQPTQMFSSTIANTPCIPTGVIPPPNNALPPGCAAAQPTQMYSSTVANTPCVYGAPVVPGQQTGPVTVSLSADNPASGYIIAGQANADLAHFVFAGSGTVNSVVLRRFGVSDSNTLTNLYLYDGATRLTSGYSFNSTGDLVMNNLGIAINGSKTISVRADVNPNVNVSPGISASSLGINLLGFTAAGNAAVAVNIRGNEMSVGNSTLAGANFSSATVSPAPTSINAGSTNQNLWSRSLTISQHATTLRAATFKMIGSAPSNTLANVGLFVDGVRVATAAVNSNNQFVFSLTAPLALATGSHLVEVHGDVVSGAFRNFYISLEQGTDLAIEDSQMPGIYVSTTSVGATAVNVNGGLVTVNNGTLTINQDTAFNNTTTLVGGSTATILGSFKFTSYGEDVKVTSLTFNPVFSGGFTPGTTLANVGLYVNGGQIGSNQTATTGTPLVFSNLGSQLLVPQGGTPVIVQIKGDVINANTGAGGNLGASVTAGTVQFNLAAGSSNAQGMSSSQLTSTASAGGQTLTISSSNVTFANSTGFSASVKAPNQNAKIGSFTVQTGSAEGITVNSIAVDLAGTLVTNNQLTNLTVKDESTGLAVGNPIGNPVATGNSFSVTVPVGISSTKMFGVYADIGSGGAGFTVTPTMTLQYRGAISNLSSTAGPAAGVQTTANVATIANTGTTFVPGSSPSNQFVIGGSTLNNIATFNIRTSNNVGGAVIKDMTFTVPANTISTITVNGHVGSVVGTTATVFNVGLVVPSDNSGVNFPVGVTLICAAQGGGCSGVSNSAVTLTLTSYTFNDGSTVQTNTPLSAVSGSHRLVTTTPSLMVAQSTTTGFGNGTLKVGEVTVSADAGGDLKIEQLPINLTVTTPGVITASSVELREVSGSTIIAGVAPVSGGAQNFVFTTPRTITKGTSETYTIYASYTGVTGAAGTQSTTFSLGPKANFLWTDVAGGVSAIPGTFIYTYSTNSQTKTN